MLMIIAERVCLTLDEDGESETAALDISKTFDMLVFYTS